MIWTIIGEERVPFRGVSDQQERSVLARAFSEYCQENRIAANSVEYDAARQLLIMLYEKEGGHHNVADLKRALVVAIRRAG